MAFLTTSGSPHPASKDESSFRAITSGILSTYTVARGPISSYPQDCFRERWVHASVRGDCGRRAAPADQVLGCWSACVRLFFESSFFTWSKPKAQSMTASPSTTFQIVRMASCVIEKAAMLLEPA
jgi:hypothetical protein